MDLRVLASGECLFREGDEGDCAYLIESGRLQVSVLKNGEQRLLAQLSADDFIGEMAFLSNGQRSATAVALEPTRLITITREHLAERLRTADPLLRHLLRLALQRSPQLKELVPPGHITPLPFDLGDDQREAVDALRLDRAIRAGIKAGEFLLHYEPFLRFASGKPAGCEALIRWDRPGHGRVSPGLFIPVAEQSDLILDIGRFVMDRACAELRRLEAVLGDPAAPPLFVSVNLSARQLTNVDLAATVRQLLRTHQVPPGRLALEVTESYLAANFDATMAVLGQCRALGVKVALDDFGTGYSSLSYLQRFPADILKFDRSLITHVAKEPATRKIVRALAMLARDLGLITVAEGIETREQHAALGELGVDLGQGYYFGKGVELPPED